MKKGDRVTFIGVRNSTPFVPFGCKGTVVTRWEEDLKTPGGFVVAFDHHPARFLCAEKDLLPNIVLPEVEVNR